MRESGTGRQWLQALMACLLLSLTTVPDGRAGEWEDMRESYDNKLKAHAKRIAEIEARERGIADQEKRAEKITRDRISGIKGSLKGGGGKARSLAGTAERAPRDAKALIDVSREQGEYLDIVMSEWRADGTERRKLRGSIATLPKNLEHVSANQARATEVAEATSRLVPESGLPEKVGRIEASEKERTRWLREQAALERERQMRERSAAERERGVR